MPDRLRRRLPERILAAATLMLAAAGARPDAAPVRVQIEEPRPFGYVVGDTLQRRIRIEAPRPWAIAADALPKPGRIDRWLELRAARLETRTEGESTRYELLATYQLMGSPEEVKLLNLPRIELRLRDGPRSRIEEVPESPFTAAPVTPAYVMGRGGLDELRPDRLPPPVPTGGISARLALYAAGIASILLYLAYARFVNPIIARRNRPFARACRELKRLRRHAAGRDALRPALRRVHRAFDETAGAALFAERLDAFFAGQPRFAGLRRAAEEFFRLSRREFFEGGTGGDSDSLERLISLCREGRRIERRA
jgi:mxaA protein